LLRSIEEVVVSQGLVVVGAPSSAGSYAPGQEKAPAALRAAGLLEFLSGAGIEVHDAGDVPGFRWRADRDHPRAMNASAAASVARATADRVAEAFASGLPVLVLGGDCTVEIGTVAGALRSTSNVGLVYVDLDTDLNTPNSTQDGALDWMGVAHMLGLEGAVPELTSVGPSVPMLRPEQLLYFANDNVEPFERQVIERLGIEEVNLSRVAADPTGAARDVVTRWATRFDRVLIHLDVDVLDFIDMPLAENVRRNVGLRFDVLMEALHGLLRARTWAALTVCELNPDHGASDGSTVKTFAKALSEALAASARLAR
jgi:arginase